MKRLLALLMAAILITGTIPFTASANDSFNENISSDTSLGDFVKNEVLVEADSLSQAEEYAKAYGAVLKSYSEYGFAVLTVPDAQKAARKKAGLFSVNSNLPPLSLNYIYETAEVKSFIPEGYIKEQATPNIDILGAPSDPRFGNQYFHQDMDSVNAWDITKGSADVVVAVIDTGIDIDHPEFAGRISKKSYNSHTDKIGIEHVDDDNNHGTHVSGIIAAAQNNEVGGSGVAPDVTIMTIKANMPSAPRFFEASSIIRGIYYAADNGADIINMSLGRSYVAGETSIEKAAIAYAVSRGVTVICAAGNDSNDHAGYPAAYEDCIAVSALTSNGKIDLSYSNYGSEVDIAAPGTLIYSTVIDGYASLTGTSMASPNVAGVAALIKSANPSFTVSQMKERLYSTAKDTYNAGKDMFVGHGTVNAYGALLGAENLIAATFNHNDGQSAGDITTRVPPGRRLYPVYPASREGYTFNGWFSEAECINAYNFDDTYITAPTTVYAKWVEGEPVADIGEFTYLQTNDHVEISSYIGNSDVVVIPNSIDGKEVRVIGATSFYGKGFIRKVVIPDTVTTIDNFAFYSCINLENIIIPDSVVNIKRSSFDSTKWYWNQPNGMIYAGKVAYHYKGGSPDNINITLKEGTLGIASYAFNKRSYSSLFRNKLASLHIPNTVKYISSMAISGCDALTEITIPGSVQTIDSQAFMDCTVLTNITLSDGMINLNSNSFEGCTALREITIPKTMEKIDALFVKNCTAFENIFVHSENNKYTDIDGVLYSKDKTRIIQYPQGKQGYVYELAPETTHIGAYSFYGNTSLVSIFMPEGLTNIESYAFDSCTGLASVTIPKTVLEILSYAFRNCVSLKSVYFMGNAPAINQYAFAMGVNLQELVMFYISENTGFTSPTWTPHIGSSLSYQARTFDGIEKSFIAPGNCVFIKNSDDQTDLSVYLYKSGYELDSITLNGKALRLGDDYTVNDRHYIIKKAVMEELEPGEYDCSFNMNNGDQNILKITVSSIEYTPESEFDFDSRLGEITKYKGERKNVTIPSKINNTTVKAIGMNAFKDNKYMETVILPETLIGIYTFAFSGCSSLSEIRMPASVSNISTYVFFNCYNLRTIDVDPLNTNYFSDNGVLYSSKNNTLMHYPGKKPDTSYSVLEGTKNIDVYAFMSASTLNEIIIPESVSSIGENAFSSTIRLKAIYVDSGNLWFTSVDGILYDKHIKRLIQYPCGITNPHFSIPHGVVSMDSMALGACTNLISITIPSTITAIPDSSFQACSNLEKVTINGNISSIGKYAFNNCGNLTGIMAYGNAPTTVDSNILTNVSSNFCIYYMKGKSGWTSPEWNGFKTAVMDEEISTSVLNNTMTKQDNTLTGKLDFTVTNSIAAQNAFVFSALYDENNNLIQILQFTANELLPLGEIGFSIPNMYLETTPTSKYILKINVWNGSDTMDPLAQQAEIIIQ